MRTARHKIRDINSKPKDKTDKNDLQHDEKIKIIYDDSFFHY